MQFPAWSEKAALEVIARTVHEPGPVLVTLQGIQEFFGYVPQGAVSLIASACNVSKADVHGVLTYYHDLLTEPPAKHQIRICVAEACQSMGAREITQEIKSKFATNSDVEVRDVFCLGNCALGPAASVNRKLRGRISAGSISREIHQE